MLLTLINRNNGQMEQLLAISQLVDCENALQNTKGGPTATSKWGLGLLALRHSAARAPLRGSAGELLHRHTAARYRHRRAHARHRLSDDAAHRPVERRDALRVPAFVSATPRPTVIYDVSMRDNFMGMWCSTIPGLGGAC
ncbi:hypothetical protein KM043_011813 [Ampulex compressa]|nr:hypothetical protein KM043_011813 [Ampulex compressa]